MLADVLSNANSNVAYNLVPSFITITTLIDDLTQNSPELFYVGNQNREFILTGFSWGATKALYAHYNKPNEITRTIIFNPFLGKWNTGYSSDPVDNSYLNPWHLARLQELHTEGAPPPLGFQNIFTHYVETDYASKYWGMSHTFQANELPHSSIDQNLALSWGINIKYPYNGETFDVLPQTLSDTLLQTETNGKAHTIYNWLHTLPIGRNPDLFIEGEMTVSSRRMYGFIPHNQDPSTDGTTTQLDPFYWAQFTGTIQAAFGILQAGTATNPVYTKDNFVWTITPFNLEGGIYINPKLSNPQLEHILYKIIDVGSTTITFLDGTTEDIPNFLIKNLSAGTFAKLNDSNYNVAMSHSQNPDHLSVEWKTEENYNSTNDPEEQKLFYWHIRPASELTIGLGSNGKRRLYNSYNPLPISGFTYNIRSKHYPNRLIYEHSYSPGMVQAIYDPNSTLALDTANYDHEWAIDWNNGQLKLYNEKFNRFMGEYNLRSYDSTQTTYTTPEDMVYILETSAFTGYYYIKNVTLNKRIYILDLFSENNPSSLNAYDGTQDPLSYGDNTLSVGDAGLFRFEATRETTQATKDIISGSYLTIA